MPTLITYAWIATVVFVVYLAAGRGIPILHAFAPIHSRPGFYFSLAVLAVVSGLAVLQLALEALLLGQTPITWAALIALIYAWVCIGRQLRKPTDS
jgi:hypothetical protein